MVLHGDGDPPSLMPKSPGDKAPRSPTHLTSSQGVLPSTTQLGHVGSAAHTLLGLRAEGSRIRAVLGSSEPAGTRERGGAGQVPLSCWCLQPPPRLLLGHAQQAAGGMPLVAQVAP